MARAVARRVLALRDGSPPTANDHWITVLLCIVLRKQVYSFAYELGEMPVLVMLNRMRGRFRFAITSDRWVEALHAVSTHLAHSAHNLGPVHIGFHSILEPMRRWLGANPEGALMQLSRKCAFVSNEFSCIKTMGLVGHETVQRLLGDQMYRSVGSLKRK